MIKKNTKTRSKKVKRAKLRKEFLKIPLDFLEMLNQDLEKIRAKPGQFAFNFFYGSKNYYKLIKCNSFKELDGYFHIEIIVEKLQNLKSYAKD